MLRGVIVRDALKTHEAGARGNDAIALAGCWAHVYRKFEEAEPDHPEANLALKWIAVLLEALVARLDEADRHLDCQLAPSRLRPACFEGTFAQVPPHSTSASLPFFVPSEHDVGGPLASPPASEVVGASSPASDWPALTGLVVAPPSAIVAGGAVSTLAAASSQASRTRSRRRETNSETVPPASKVFGRSREDTDQSPRSSENLAAAPAVDASESPGAAATSRST